MNHLKIVILVLVALIAVGAIIWYFGFLKPSQPEQPEQPSLSQEKLSFEERINKLDSPQKLVDYLNKYYTFEEKENNKALSPKEFFEKKKGSGKDFAVFSAYVLDKHGYESLVIHYKYGEEGINTITIFRGEEPKYISFSEPEIKIFNAGDSFEDTFTAEDERLGINITSYKVFLPGVIDFTKKEWTNRGEL